MNLGEIRKAHELGYKGHNSYIWQACTLCGRERWIELRKGSPKHTVCLVCVNIAHRKKQEQSTQGHMCPPHYWLIDSGNIGRCKYCGEVKDFDELQYEFAVKVFSK